MSQRYVTGPPGGLCGTSFAGNTRTTIVKCYGSLSSEFDRASASRMYRGVLINGAEAPLIESLVADSKPGMQSAETESLPNLFPGVDRDDLTHKKIGNSIQQGNRRQKRPKPVRSKAADARLDSSRGWAGAVRQLMSSRFDVAAPENGLEFSLDRAPSSRMASELMLEQSNAHY